MQEPQWKYWVEGLHSSSHNLLAYVVRTRTKGYAVTVHRFDARGVDQERAYLLATNARDALNRNANRTRS